MTKDSSITTQNDVSKLQPKSFHGWLCSLFDYQFRCREAKDIPTIPRTRNICKSRQIGISYYFSGEALEDAVLTGDNQIFVSESPEQVDIFRDYIIYIAREFLQIELSGNPIVLSNGAELHFVSSENQHFAALHGNVYIDEYAWLSDFTSLNKIISACAAHSRWRKTYMTTLSEEDHPSYKFWTGDDWKNRKASRKDIEFPTLDQYREGGRVCPDRQWRYVITVEDAVAQGCNLIDVNELRKEYTEDEFQRLFMCNISGHTTKRSSTWAIQV